MEIRLLGEARRSPRAGRSTWARPGSRRCLRRSRWTRGGRGAVETLIDRVWGDEPPAEARSVLYSHLSRIRQLLRQAAACDDGHGDGADNGADDGPVARLERRHAGYVLDIGTDRVDLNRFWRLAEAGRDPSRADAERASALRRALGL